MKNVTIEKMIYDALNKDYDEDITIIIKPIIPKPLSQEIKEMLENELNEILNSNIIKGNTNIYYFKRLSNFLLNNYKKIFSETDIYDDLHDIVTHRITKRDVLYLIDICHEYISTLLDNTLLPTSEPKVYIDYKTGSTEYFGFRYNDLLKELDLLTNNIKKDLIK